MSNSTTPDTIRRQSPKPCHQALTPLSSSCFVLPPPKSPSSSSQPAGGAAMDGISSSPSVPLIPLVTSCCSERKPKLCTSPLPYGPPLSECDSAALSPFCFARLRSHRVHPRKPPHSPQSSTPALALVARRYLIRCEFLLMKLIQPSALGRLTHSSNDLFSLCGNRLSRVK